MQTWGYIPESRPQSRSGSERFIGALANAYAGAFSFFTGFTPAP